MSEEKKVFSYTDNEKIGEAIALDKEIQARLDIHVARWQLKKAELMHEVGSHLGWKTRVSHIDGDKNVAVLMNGDHIVINTGALLIVKDAQKLGDFASELQDKALEIHQSLWDTIYSELNLDRELNWELSMRDEVVAREKEKEGLRAV